MSAKTKKKVQLVMNYLSTAHLTLKDGTKFVLMYEGGVLPPPEKLVTMTRTGFIITNHRPRRKSK